MRTLITLAALSLATPALAQEVIRPPVDQPPPEAPICIDADPPVLVPDTAVLAAKLAAFKEPAGLSAPQLRRIQNAARAFVAGHDDIAVQHIAAAVTDAVAQVGVTNYGSEDIESLAFMILIEASRDAQQDLRMILADIQHDNERKQSLRDHENALRQLRADLEASCLGSELCDRETLAGVDARLARDAADMDSLNELAQEDQLLLQQSMDRKQQLLATISNILKKTSDTAQSITQNLK